MLNWPSRVLFLLLLPLVLLACGGGEGNATAVPTARPTLTATPRSTELPPVATPVRVGTDPRPMQLAFLTPPDASTRQAATDLAEALEAELSTFQLGLYDGLAVEVEFLEDTPSALDALCDGQDSAVFVDAMTYAAAAQNCGALPALQVVRDGETGVAFDIIVNRSILANITLLRNRAFCAMSYDDPFSFVYPVLALRANGVDPLDDFSDIFTGFESETEMLLAVSGMYEPNRLPLCAGTAMRLSDYDRIVEELLNDPDRGLTQVQANQLILPQLASEDSTWTPIPYEILVFPPPERFPPVLREQLVSALLDLQSDAGSAQADLQSILPHDELRAVVPADYAEFIDWLNRAGWNMAAANN